MKRFTKNNQPFTCLNCGKFVEKHPQSSRDHCNYCLYGLHIDIYPGDRANQCKSALKPLSIETRNGKTKIIYVCERCGSEIRNIIAPDDDILSFIKTVKDVSYLR